MYAAAPVPLERPASMRWSTWLLFAVAGCTLLEATIDLVFTNTGLSVYKDAFTGDTGSGFVSLAGATFSILFAAGTCILAILNSHGRKNARVTTLVLGGIYLICGSFGTLIDIPSNAGGSAGEGALARVLPTAYGLTVAGLDVLVVLGVLGALILLAVPASNRFFMSRQFADHQFVPVVQQPPPYYPQPGPPQHLPPPSDPTPVPDPHTSSIPAIDPWAAPEDDHQPRHRADPSTGY